MTQEATQPQLSRAMTPKKIQPGEIKKFKLLNAGSLDTLTGEASYNSGATFEGISTVWDVEKKELVIIKNITGKRVVSDKEGKKITEEIVSPVEFDNSGVLRVDYRQPETYLFAVRDNRNLNNPFRDKNVEAVWYEVLEENIKEREQFRNNLEYDAMTLCRSNDTKAILAIAKVLAEKKLIDINLNGPVKDIRWEMEKCCKINPSEVIRASKEKLPILKLDIQDAVKYGEMEYQHDGNVWVWSKKYGEEANIHKITPGEDPLEALATFVLTEKEAMAKKPKEERVETLYEKIKDTLKELSVEAD